MKRIPTIALILVLTIPLLFSCKSNSIENMDPITKEEIIKLYEDDSGKKIEDPDDFCIEEARSLKGVYSLGWFAHDRGCMGNEILVGRKIGKPEELTAKALELNGWGDKSKQKELALNWVMEVMLAWEGPLSSGGEDFERDDAPD